MTAPDTPTDDPREDHAAIIKRWARDLAQGNIWATDRHIETIDRHTDALAAENAALRGAIRAALTRYDRADAEIDHKGFVRGEVAWAMADDLRQAAALLAEGKED